MSRKLSTLLAKLRARRCDVAGFAAGLFARASSIKPGSAPVEATSLEASETAIVFRRFVEAFNRGDVAGQMAQFADDAIFLGGGFCHGNPCIGPETIAEGFLRPTAGIGIADMRGDRMVGDTLFGHWMMRVTDGGLPVGTGRIRGSFEVTAKNGRITRYVLAYDLTDPSTVLLRTMYGHVVLSFQEASGLRTIEARALLTGLSPPIGTAVTVYPTGFDSGVSGSVHVGTTCSNPEATKAYPLRSIVDGRFDIVIPVPIEQIINVGLSIVIEFPNRTRDRVQRPDAQGTVCLS